MFDDVSIIIPCAPNETAHEALLKDLEQTKAEIIISSEGARGISLNAGAAKARNEMLWFLHADSRLNAQNIEALDKAIAAQPLALHYFDIKFDQAGLVQMNGVAANIRSRLFGLPYGDQGLCISKTQFDMVGGYPEDATYGEDVLFVRKAKKAGVKLNPVRSKMLTSARKYSARGWLRVTALHQKYIFKLLREKI